MRKLLRIQVITKISMVNTYYEFHVAELRIKQ